MSRELSGICKLVNKQFIAALDQYYGFTTNDPIFIEPELRDAFYKLVTMCGFEKLGDGKPPVYVQFPMRTAALINVCKISPGAKFENVFEGVKEDEFSHCELVEEHDDGDLTVKTKDHIYVITTDGKIFREVQPQDR